MLAQKTYQPRTILEEITNTLVGSHGVVNWVLVLKFISFFNLSNIGSYFLYQPVRQTSCVMNTQTQIDLETRHKALLRMILTTRIYPFFY
jgi:hypothetical protein